MSPLPMQWDGEALRPLKRFQKLADEAFVIGETYPMAPVEARSSASHNQYFALLHEAWLNLPEQLGDRYPDEESLRKFALIKAGFRDERSIVCASKAEAARVAAFVKPMDPYAVVIVSEAVVVVYTAKSQSKKAMGAQVFQKSKEAVLDVLAEMIGTRPGFLAARAAAA